MTQNRSSTKVCITYPGVAIRFVEFNDVCDVLGYLTLRENVVLHLYDFIARLAACLSDKHSSRAFLLALSFPLQPFRAQYGFHRIKNEPK